MWNTFLTLCKALTGQSIVSIPTRIELPGAVIITHNEQGIPHVSAPTDSGAIFGQGYLAGLHRSFQMEMNRRTVAARLSQISGSALLEMDRWICRLGIPQAVEASYREAVANPELMDVLQHYSNGVNFAFQQYSCTSFEFALLGIRPEPWTPMDCVRILELFSWSLAGNWEEQFVRMQIAGVLEAEQAALLEGRSFPLPLTLSSTLTYAKFLQSYQDICQHARLLPRRSGSNAFVVGGNHTNTGMPILAADPHMPLGLPGLFFQCILESKMPTPGFTVPLHAAGAAIPGVPGVISGRNEALGWSITLTGAITAELRLEHKDVSTRSITHRIPVKGKEPVEEIVQWTEHGPLLVLPGEPDDLSLSLCWVGYKGDVAGTIEAIWKLNHAKSAVELCQAAKSWSAPVVNLVFAEVEREQGAFGWVVAGRIPSRHPDANGLLPVPGWIEHYQWKEYISPEELPHEVNPARGYSISANQQHASDDYPYVISHEYISPHRALRIEQLIIEALQSSSSFKVEHARSIQTDQTSLAAIELRDLIVQHITIPEEERTPRATAFRLLLEWDGSLSAKSCGAAILKVTESHLLVLVARRLFTSQELINSWLGIGHTPLLTATMSHWRMQEVLSTIIRSQTELSTITPNDWSSLFQQAFEQAVVELQALQGKDASAWTWGKLHQLEIAHALVQQPPYKKLPLRLRLLRALFRLSRGPYPVGGDEHTPWQTSFFPVPLSAQSHERRFWANAYQPAVRIIASSGGWLYTCLPGGTSGQTTHAWSDNQLGTYLDGELYRLKL